MGWPRNRAGRALVERCSKISERRQDLADEAVFGLRHGMLGDYPCTVSLPADSLDEPESSGQVQAKSV
jgi:hypothetical protein